MARAIWKGAIAFGLVHVPVALYPASQETEVNFDWLDKRSLDPVGYKRINKRTGKEVDKRNIVKGVEQDDGSYVVLSDDEVRAAYPRTTQTIEIEDFVPATEISFVYLEKPYYLEPSARAEKVYALLREAMASAGLIGIARMVMHIKEHLVALLPAGPALMLGTLRWPNEVRAADQLNLPAQGKAQLKDAELDMARQLIARMKTSWEPDKYEDRFTDAIRKLIAAKVKAGEAKTVEPLEQAPEVDESNVVDLTALLKSSLGQAKAPRKAARKASRAAAPNGPKKKARA